MVLNMKVTFSAVRCTVKEFVHGKMELFTAETLQRVRNRVMVK